MRSFLWELIEFLADDGKVPWVMGAGWLFVAPACLAAGDSGSAIAACVFSFLIYPLIYWMAATIEKRITRQGSETSAAAMNPEEPLLHSDEEDIEGTGLLEEYDETEVMYMNRGHGPEKD